MFYPTVPQCFHVSQCSLSGTVLFWSRITNCLNTFAPGITSWELCPLDELWLSWAEPPQAAVVCHHHLSLAQSLSHTGELLAGKWSWQGVVFRSGVNVSRVGNVMGFPQWNSSHALAVGFVEFWVFMSLFLWNKGNVLIVHWCEVEWGG